MNRDEQRRNEPPKKAHRDDKADESVDVPTRKLDAPPSPWRRTAYFLPL